ncbi:Protein CBG17479 [Caenorhabditis briggsae]|uniref:Protein CBG17479 n=1 Tax=Caenorhabditis briggsae TaxID=6238 RepID=A8XR37_CAEBR|nr:Protein CBG17479 [Caenorhabditis briggsae]CAP35110.1 Protein CBG17479 [Caenorhabditis briggsae]
MTDKFERPGKHWNIDHLGPLPVTEKGNRYILCFRDPFSRYLVAEAVESQNAETKTETFINRVISVHGVPESITTDCGTAFTSTVFKESMKKLGIHHKLAAPYHHASNGIVERANRTIEECLSAYVNASQSDWDEFLPLTIFSINNTPDKTTKLAASEIIFGRKPDIPENNVLKTRYHYGEDYNSKLQNRLQLLWEQCREKNKKTSPQYGRINERQLKAGDSILVQRQQPENKLAPKLKGPFKVLEIKGKNVHFADDRKIIRTAHKDEMRGLPGPKAEDGIERHPCGQKPRRSKRIAEKKGE